jgi:hypothetical protein
MTMQKAIMYGGALWLALYLFRTSGQPEQG